MAAAVKESRVIVLCVAADSQIAGMISRIVLERAGPVSGGVRTSRDDESGHGRDGESKKSEGGEGKHG